MARLGMARTTTCAGTSRIPGRRSPHLIRLGEIKTLTAAIAKQWRASAATSCKPTAASIFASCWNEFVLKKDLARPAGQQRLLPRQHPADGTYSVVPRMAPAAK